MTPRVADRVALLPPYPLAQVAQRKRELIAAGMDVIDLGAGDADVPPPDVAKRALAEALGDLGMHKYASQLGLPAFRQAVVRYHERRFGQRFDPLTEIQPLVGSKEGIGHLAQVICNPGDVAIVPEPGYQCYLGGSICAGAEVHVAPLTPRTDFLVELGELPSDLLRRTRIVFLNYPNNPTAAVAPREYLERTVAIAREHGIVIAYDNAYAEITYDGYTAPSIFEVEGAREVAVEFHSCSKSFSMTGWRLGWALGAAGLIAALAKVKSYFDTGAFLAIQSAGAQVLDRSEDLVRPLVETFRKRRDVAVAALTHAGFTVTVPKATLYLWIPLPPQIKSHEFADRAMNETGVVVLPGRSFGASAEGYFRVALTVPEARLEEAAVRLGKTLSRM